MAKIELNLGFDASSRRITLDGEPYGEPIAVISRIEGEGFDYQAEADATCSTHWNPQNVILEDFHRTLKQFVELASILNLYKKLLFRGVEPGAINMPQPAPGESMADHGCAIPFDMIDLVHGILGDATESGETAAILLDVLGGYQPDRVNVIEECGDKRWYINRMLRWAGATDLQCEMTNIDKLHGRHGSSFDVFRDANRNLERERQRLEEAAAEAKPLKRKFFGQPDK